MTAISVTRGMTILSVSVPMRFPWGPRRRRLPELFVNCDKSLVKRLFLCYTRNVVKKHTYFYLTVVFRKSG